MRSDTRPRNIKAEEVQVLTRVGPPHRMAGSGLGSKEVEPHAAVWAIDRVTEFPSSDLHCCRSGRPKLQMNRHQRYWRGHKEFCWPFSGQLEPVPVPLLVNQFAGGSGPKRTLLQLAYSWKFSLSGFVREIAASQAGGMLISAI